MRAQLLFRGRKGPTQTFALQGEECFVGRDPGIAVSIPREGISRRHAKVVFDGRDWTLEDLGSTNGTFLNGQPATSERLRHLDVVGLGKDIDLIFVLRADESRTVMRVGILDASLTLEAPGAAPEKIPPGEVTLGRSQACNIVLDQGAISKMHCRIVRTHNQLTVEDLGSSNGTFVNGERVMTAVLHDGDALGVGGVAVLKVKVELGEVTSSSGVHEAPVAPAPKAAERRFSEEWKTRFEWDPAEQAEIEAFQKQLREQDARRSASGETAKPGAKGAAGVPARGQPAPAAPPKAPAAAPAGAKPAAAPAPRAEPPATAPKPPAAAAAKPAADASKQTPAAVPAATPAPPAAAPAKPAPPAPSRAPAQPAPTLPVSDKAPAPAAAPAPASPSPAKPVGRILELHLQAPGTDLVATETGAHEIGRGKDAQLRINNATVSRQHARIIIADDRSAAYLQDRGGANGTSLNGVQIKEIKLLSDGDAISVGEVTLKVSFRRG